MSLTCYRKKAYSSQSAAMGVVYRMRARGTEGIDAYKCDKCKAWHLQATRAIPATTRDDSAR